MVKNELLRKKLEVFINKYYQNLLIKGGMYAVGLGATYFFVMAMAEYFGRFGTGVRLMLLIALIVGMVSIIGYYILYPLTGLLKIGKRISYERAAKIIGRHFPEVDDKLLNAVQLQGITAAQSELLQASIDQRIEKLSPVPFSNAVNFNENVKYWPVLVIPILIFLGVIVSGKWGDISESGKRIAAFNKEFVPEAPFTFELHNQSLKVEEGQPLTVEMSLKGNKIASEALLLIAGEEMRMNKADGRFKLTLPAISHDTEFRFKAAGFYSKTHHVQVLEVPQLQEVTVQIVPPAYTGIKALRAPLKTVHDVPEGSRVNWTVSSRKVDKAWLSADTTDYNFEHTDDGKFELGMVVHEDMEYAIELANEIMRKRGVAGNQLRVVEDKYPQVEVKFQQDTVSANTVYYSGVAIDDYKVSRLELVIEADGNRSAISLKEGLSDRYQIRGVLSMDSLVGKDNTTAKLYFKVWDNDGVNGSKFSVSAPYVMELTGTDKRKEELQKGYKAYFESKSEQRQDMEELKKSMEEIRKALMEKRSLSFNEKTKMKEMLKKQEELLKKQKEDEELLEKLKKEEEKLGLKKEELKEEEDKIDELKSKDEELDELLKEIEELMEKLDTKKLQKKLEELDRRNQSMQRKEERREDLLKDLNFKKDILESAEKLQEMAREMDELAKETGSEEDENKRQQEVKEEFDKVSEKIEEMKEDNPDFAQEVEEQKLEEQQEGAEQQMDQSQQKLNKQDAQGANENQKKAGEKMQEMSQSLQNSMMAMQSQSNKENIETLRQILENLETVSFEIEELSDKSRTIRRDDPGIKKILTEQKKLMLGTKLIEDSLLALASRAPQVEQFVFEELDDMKYNLDKGIENLQELEVGKASAHQQYVMTAANNLAVMLEKSLQQMQQMQAQMMQGQQQCQKPGSKPDGQTLKEMQSEMGKMMDRLKQGQKEGKDGKMSKEMVETISKQEQLRQALEEMQKKDGGDGSKGSRQKAIEELKKLQDDLMEGKIADNYRERLKNIETRMLESEKAERKQKQEERRESKTAENLQQIYKDELEKYLKEKGVEEENLQLLPVELQNYYKTQANQYLGVQ